MHMYSPALEAAAPTVFVVWLRAWARPQNVPRGRFDVEVLWY